VITLTVTGEYFRVKISDKQGQDMLLFVSLKDGTRLFFRVVGDKLVVDTRITPRESCHKFSKNDEHKLQLSIKHEVAEGFELKKGGNLFIKVLRSDGKTHRKFVPGSARIAFVMLIDRFAAQMAADSPINPRPTR